MAVTVTINAHPDGSLTYQTTRQHIPQCFAALSPGALMGHPRWPPTTFRQRSCGVLYIVTQTIDRLSSYVHMTLTLNVLTLKVC